MLARSSPSPWTRSAAAAPSGCSPSRSRPRWTPTSSATETSGTAGAAPWWSATAPPREGRWSPGPGPSRCAHRGWTTAASIPRRASAPGSQAPSCPPYARRSPKVAEVLPLLYLHGLSTKDFVPALAEFFGTSAGLSASAITRLTTSWSAEREAFMGRDLSQVDYVYVWVDGVHFTVRLGEDDRLCVLVMVGVRTDGTKELVAISDGYRESTESWAELLRDCRRRGMRAPVLAVGDGALGFWAAVRDVFPKTRHQADWVHKAANVLDALPASVQVAARRAMREIWDAEDKTHAERALEAFARDFAKWPKAVRKLTKDREAVLAFYDYPAEHWIHLRTSNPIESTFAPVRARTDVTKGPGSRAAGLAMCFKLIEAAEGRWRR